MFGVLHSLLYSQKLTTCQAPLEVKGSGTIAFVQLKHPSSCLPLPSLKCCISLKFVYSTSLLIESWKMSSVVAIVADVATTSVTIGILMRACSNNDPNPVT